MSDSKIEVIPQQDAITVEADDDSLAISQIYASEGHEQRIYVMGKVNVYALITALEKAVEDMSAA
jgi:hypothetical protein